MLNDAVISTSFSNMFVKIRLLTGFPLRRFAMPAECSIQRVKSFPLRNDQDESDWNCRLTAEVGSGDAYKVESPPVRKSNGCLCLFLNVNFETHLWVVPGKTNLRHKQSENHHELKRWQTSLLPCGSKHLAVGTDFLPARAQVMHFPHSRLAPNILHPHFSKNKFTGFLSSLLG